MEREEFITQFIKDYDAGLIRVRTAAWEPGVPYEDPPTEVAYTGLDGAFADMIYFCDCEPDGQ